MCTSRTEINGMSSLPRDAVRIEYTVGVGEVFKTSSYALFVVRDHIFSKEFHDLKADLKRDLASRRDYLNYVKSGKFVAFRTGIEWWRAYVIHNGKFPHLGVFFIDYALSGDIEYSIGLCQKLPKEYDTRRLASQSYKISLYGVTPMTREIRLYENSDEACLKPCEHWQPYHVDFMKEQMANADTVFFQPIFQEDEIKFGYIFVEMNRSVYSLNDLLIEKKYAMKCDKEDFEKNRIPALLDYFRHGWSFDRKLSVREKLWPYASFNREREKRFCRARKTERRKLSDGDSETCSIISSASSDFSFPTASCPSDSNEPRKYASSGRPTSSISSYEAHPMSASEERRFNESTLELDRERNSHSVEGRKRPEHLDVTEERSYRGSSVSSDNSFTSAPCLSDSDLPPEFVSNVLPSSIPRHEARPVSDGEKFRPIASFESEGDGRDAHSVRINSPVSSDNSFNSAPCSWNADAPAETANIVRSSSCSPCSWDAEAPPEYLDNDCPISSKSNYDMRPESRDSFYSMSPSDMNRDQTRAPCVNGYDSNHVIDSKEYETEDYGSENVAPKNLNYADYLKEATMPSFSRMRDEILVVGNENYFEPVVSCNSIIDGRTRETMRDVGIRDINRNQGYMIPAMLSRVRKDIFLVDAPRSGKTEGCLIALVSLLRETNATKHVTCGPRSIVVLPYADRCEFVQDRCVELVTGKRGGKVDERMHSYDLRVMMAYGCGKALEFRNMNEISRGCDILVCTPRCLLRLMENTVGFDLQQLEYAVFDEFHILRENFVSETREIMKTIQNLRRKNLRRVFISNTSQAVKSVVVDTSKQMILIPCYLEAAVFVKFKYELIYREDASKILAEIKERLCSEWKSKIVVIVLNDEEESLQKMVEIKSVVRNCGKPIHEFKPSRVIEMDDKLKILRHDICCEKKPLILCTDSALGSMPEKIYDADCLIHYSLPSKLNAFRKRFSVILNRVQDLGEVAVQPSMSTSSRAQKPQVISYVTKNEMERFPRLFKIMTQLITETPSWTRELLKKIEYRTEMEKSEVCLNVKQLGRCVLKETCKDRHIFLKDKEEPDPLLPRTGQLKIEIIHVYSPTHFRARLLLHRPASVGEWKQIKIMSNVTLTMKMSMYYGKNKPESVEHVQEGDLLAIEDADGRSTMSCYRRVRVMKIIDEKPRKAVLKFVDMGKEMTRNVAALCKLPPDLASVPETTVDIFLCNVQPIDEDIKWGNVFFNMIQERINEQKAKNNDFIGNIQLVVGRSIWVDPLLCESYSKELQTKKVEFWFSRYLVQEKLALKNPEHLPALRQLCREAGIDCGETNVISNGAPSQKESSDTPSNHSPATLRSTNEQEIAITPSKSSCAADEESSAPNSNLVVQRRVYLSYDEPKPSDHSKKQEVTFRPLVYWKQDETSLTLIIRKNIDEYVVRSDCLSWLYFRGKEGDTVYEFEEKLFDGFDNATLKHKKSGVTIVIKMEKTKIGDHPWERLLARPERVNWLKEDIDSLLEDHSDSSDSSFEPVANFSAKKSQPRRSLLEKKLGYKPCPDDLSETDSETEPEDNIISD